jgi:hypothetical protein
MYRYHDGYSAQDLDKESIKMVKMFYPKYWLDATGFWNSQMNTGDNVLLFNSWSGGSSRGKGNIEISWGVAMLFLILTVSVSVYGGMYMAKRNMGPATRQYVQIDI